MSARFIATSSQGIVTTTAPAVAYPFTVGGWVRIPAAAASDAIIWGAANNGAASNYWEIRMTTSPTLLLTARNTTDAPTNTTQLIAGNEWTFFIGRFIAAANRRLTGYFAGGLIQSTQSTSSSTPTPNSESIGFRNASGATGFFNGDIAELWRTDTDIQPDGAAINSDLVRQLAWRGPFSVPHVAAAIQQYFSFFESPNPTREEIGDVRFQRFPLTWTNRGTGEPTIADHPPLWPDYSVLNPRSALFTV